MSLRGKALKGVNKMTRPLGIQLVRGTADPAVEGFISAKKTIAAAERAGLSVGDYIDQNHAEPGTTATTVEAMLELSGLDAPVNRVCEIGAGSGRYAEKVIAALHPRVYEVYEPATDWLPHLRQLPNLITQPCDGRTLGSTESVSVDLVHAHKVFVYLRLMATISYLEEMERVVRPGGVVAFDVVTEDCLDNKTLDAWVTRGHTYVATPRGWLIKFLAKRGLSLQGNFFAAMTGGKTELLVFRRE